MSKTYVVYLKITGSRDGGWCVVKGCGSWGKGATVDAARKIARGELRKTFGPGYKTEERIEEVSE